MKIGQLTFRNGRHVLYIFYKANDLVQILLGIAGLVMQLPDQFLPGFLGAYFIPRTHMVKEIGAHFYCQVLMVPVLIIQPAHGHDKIQ